MNAMAAGAEPVPEVVQTPEVQFLRPGVALPRLQPGHTAFHTRPVERF